MELETMNFLSLGSKYCSFYSHQREVKLAQDHPNTGQKNAKFTKAKITKVKSGYSPIIRNLKN